MPDAWERQHGLNPNDAADASLSATPGGYSNIENYINNVDPAKQTDWTNLENNTDTLRPRYAK